MSRIKTKTHKLRGGVFYVDFIPVFTQDDGTGKDDSETDAIEVKSTPDVIVIGLLEMYFENPRSGGSQDCVKETKLIDSETAHVIFRTPEGLFFRPFHNCYQKNMYVQLLPASWQKKVTSWGRNL